MSDHIAPARPLIFARAWHLGWLVDLSASAWQGGKAIIHWFGRMLVPCAIVLQAVAASGAVYVAWHTLDRTATQLNGTTIYNVAKDGKALQRRFENGEATPDEVMSYFFSVYTLHQNQVLNDRTWRPIEIALCNFVKSGPNVQQAWQKYRVNYDLAFQDLVDGLRGRKCE
jgi:hypothetical protein